MAGGVVLLVGYLPGEAGALAVRAAEALARAALVIAPPDAPAWLRAQVVDGAWAVAPATGLALEDALGQRLRQALAGGELVVRCYPGDPLADVGGAAELSRLLAAGIAVEVVPAPQVALAAATYAGVSLVPEAGPVTLLAPTLLTAGVVVPAGGTVLVPVGPDAPADQAAAALVRSGLAGTTPAVVVREPGTPRQAIWSGSLDHLATVTDARAAGPGVLIAGAAAARRAAWFERRPLHGLRVLVTRAAGQAGELSARLRAAGAEPVELPVIRIAPPDDLGPLDAAVRRLASYDWVIFTSANGVDALFARIDALSLDSRAFGGARVAVIGPATAERLRARGVRADYMPARFIAEALLEGLVARGVAGARVLLPRAERAREVLPAGLRAAGATVDVVAAYRTVLPDEPAPGLEALAAGAIDVVTLTSSSTARHLVALARGRVDLINRARVACIGPITAATARELGLRVDVVAEEHSIPGLVAALEAAAERSCV